jgi:DNA-binding beta-propeller fold protein YncE
MQPLTVRALSALAIGLFFAGCSGTGSTAIAPSGTIPDSLTHLTRSAGPDVPVEYLYVTNAGSNNVSIFSIGSLGVLTAAGPPVAAGSGPRGLAVGLNSYLYVANTASNNVSAFQITAGTGALTPITGSPFAAGTAPDGVAYTGKCLYVANGGSNNVSEFRIAGAGALTLVATISAGTGPENVAADPVVSAPFVYVTNETSNNISAYKMAGTCKLTTVGSYSAGGTGAFGLAVDPTGSYVVVANLGSSNVSFFHIGSSGALTLAGTASAGGTNPVGVAISGAHAFIPNQSSDTVSAYNAAGALGSYATDSYPQGVAVDPLGTFAYVANEFTNDVSGYRISGGVLTPTVPATFPAGTAPEYVATCKQVSNSCEPPPL